MQILNFSSISGGVPSNSNSVEMSQTDDSPKRKNYTEEEKLAILKYVIIKGRTSRPRAKELKVPPRTIRRWQASVVKGENLNSLGRPEKITPELLETIKKHFTVDGIVMNFEDFKKLVFEEHASILIKRGEVPGDTRKQLSDTSLRKIIKTLDLRIGNADPVTKNRNVAHLDVRSFITFAAAALLVSKMCKPELIINMDSTQLACMPTKEKKIKSVYRTRAIVQEPSFQQPIAVQEVQGTKLTQFYIKTFHIISAGGYSAEPIYVLADENLATGAMEIFKVPGLGMSTLPENYGYVIFSKHRGCCASFYKWIYTEIVPSFVKRISAAKAYDADETAYFQIDGESPQVSNLLDEDTRCVLQESNIIVGKAPAATSAWTQPLDAGHIFLAAKTTSRGKSAKYKVFGKNILSRLDHLFANRKGFAPSQLGDKARESILRAQYCFHSALRTQSILDSFSVVGLHDIHTGTFNLETIQRQFPSVVTKENELTIGEKLAFFSRVLEEKGEITDEDMDRAGIEKTQNKSLLTPICRRHIFLTSPEFLRYEARRKLALKKQSNQRRSEKRASKRQEESESEEEAEISDCEEKRTKRARKYLGIG